jgi:hypothetical protein
MGKVKKTVCGNEIDKPQLTPIYCPCGIKLGDGGVVDVTDPCFSPSWDKTKDHVVIEGVRIDRRRTLRPEGGPSTRCDQCALERRQHDDPWEKK